jgi:hypothetical protein
LLWQITPEWPGVAHCESQFVMSQLLSFFFCGYHSFTYYARTNIESICPGAVDIAFTTGTEDPGSNPAGVLDF